MKTTTEIKSQLLTGLAAVVDVYLIEEHFCRKAGSPTYIRKLNAAEQQITFAIDCFPSYEVSAEAHIQPALQLRMPEVSATALILVNGDAMLLANSPEIILNQPIEFTASKDKHQRWFATGSEGFINQCVSIREFMKCWVIPFLSEVSTPADLVRLYQTQDKRIMRQKHWHIFVVAAYQILGENEKAREVVLREFSKPGLRKRYASLFDTLGIL